LLTLFVGVTLPLVATAQATPTVIPHQQVLKAVTRPADTSGTSSKVKKLEGANWCTTKGHPFFDFTVCWPVTDDDSLKVATSAFWGRADTASSLEFGRMLNTVGDKDTQSNYVELIADYWGTFRIAVGGVYNVGSDSTRPAVEDKSKIQAFLNKGGPAVLTIERPLAIMKFGATQTVLMTATHASFSPSQGQSAADSVKYAETGLNLQTTVTGTNSRINGIGFLHTGGAFGGKPFYRAVGRNAAFMDSYFSLGLVIENTATISWSRLLHVPPGLRKNPDSIRINFTRPISISGKSTDNTTNTEQKKTTS